MGHASTLKRPPRRRAVFSWLRSVTVAAAAAVAGLVGLDAVGRPAAAPMLRASFVAAPVTPDVRLEPAAAPVAPPPAPVAAAAPAAPAAARKPVKVPSDPYAAEKIVQIGTLRIPKLGVDQRLMQGITLRNIDHGPSHWPGTALAGESGNMVVAGHRVTHSKPFRNIDQLKPGDEIIVTTHGRQAIYRTASTFVVSPDRTEIADPTPTPMLTMFACHPPGSARQRIVVRADLATGSSV